MTVQHGGYESGPRPPSRRDFFDIRRTLLDLEERILNLESATTSLRSTGSGTPTDRRDTAIGTSSAGATGSGTPTDQRDTAAGVAGGSGLSSILVPASGAWFGATAAHDGSSGHTSTLGLSQWNTEVSFRPHILCWYFKGPGTQTIFTSELLAMLDPGGGEKHAIPFMHIKFGPDSGTAGSWQAVAAGTYDSQIDEFGNQMAAYGSPVFVSIFHEPENNVNGTDMTKAQYVSMWQRVVNRWIANGVTNIITVMQYTAWAGWAEDSIGTGFEDLWPGDAYVDWMGWDPYSTSSTPDGLDVFLQHGLYPPYGPNGWGGFYDWAQTYHSNKPFMLCEWGFAMASMGDAAAATRLDALVTDGFANYPDVKAYVYWNAQGAGDYQVQGRALQSAAMASLVQDPYFDQDPDLAL